MSNKEQLELIAQARELCEKKVAFYLAPELGKHAKENQIAWTTHLAEMDEHKTEWFTLYIWQAGVNKDNEPYEGGSQLSGPQIVPEGEPLNEVNEDGSTRVQNLYCVKCYQLSPCQESVTKVKRLLGVE